MGHFLDHDFFCSESLLLYHILCISFQVLEFDSDLLDMIGHFEFLFPFDFPFSFLIIEEEFDLINDVIRCGDLFLVEHDFLS